MSVDISRDIFIPLGQSGADAFDDTTRWIDDNNRRLSDRLWLARKTDRDAIDAILREAVVSGDDPLKAAKRLEDYLTPVGQATRTKTPRSGNGNYAARRLARTEVSRAFNEASRRAAELNPFVEGVKWNLSGSHDEPDECNDRANRSSRGMPRGVYRFGDEPRMPSHPQCRCYWTPITVAEPEDIVAQVRRDMGQGDEPFAPRRSGVFDTVVTLYRAAKALLTREAA